MIEDASIAHIVIRKLGAFMEVFIFIRVHLEVFSQSFAMTKSALHTDLASEIH